MSEERKAALKELEHPDPLARIFACMWLLKDAIDTAKMNSPLVGWYSYPYGNHCEPLPY
jgi:hypothetical protein